MKLLHAAAAAIILAGCASVGTGEDKKVTSPLDYTLKDIDGKDLDLSKFKGKVVLLVNVASECGYTPQYEGLQELYAKYEKDGLVVDRRPGERVRQAGAGDGRGDQEVLHDQVQGHLPDDVEGRRQGEGPGRRCTRLLASKDTEREWHFEQVGWNFEKFLIGRDGQGGRAVQVRGRPERG